MGPQMRGCQGPGGGEGTACVRDEQWGNRWWLHSPVNVLDAPALCADNSGLRRVSPQTVLPKESEGYPETIQPSVTLFCRSRGWTLSRRPLCITSASGCLQGSSLLSLHHCSLKPGCMSPLAGLCPVPGGTGAPPEPHCDPRPQLDHMLKGALDVTGESVKGVGLGSLQTREGLHSGFDSP